MRETLLQTHQQPVVLCSNTRLQICNGIRTSNSRIEHCSDSATDDEVCPEVVQIVGAKHVVRSKLALHPDVHLLNHGVLHRIVDDVNSGGAGPRKNESGKWICQRRSAGRELTHRRIERITLNE